MRIAKSSVLLGFLSLSACGPEVDAPTAASGVEAEALTATRKVSCTGVANHSPRPSARQTVTFSLSVRNVPSSVTVLNSTGVALAANASVTLDNSWWTSTFKTTNNWNQWKLKVGGSNVFHLMVPSATPGATFSGELVEEFFSGTQSLGNWQTPFTCTLQ